MLINPTQNKTLHALLNKAGLMGEKATLVAAYTHQRTEHSKEMTTEEAAALIGFLRTKCISDSGGEPSYAGTPEDKMRKKIIGVCREMGWEVEKNGKKVADMQAINTFCKEKGKFKKALNDHTYSELVELVSQFQMLKKNPKK